MIRPAATDRAQAFTGASASVILSRRFAGRCAPMAEIRDYFENRAPKSIRKAIQLAKANEFLDGGYPHPDRMKKKAYDRELDALQIELLKLQSWTKATGERVVLVF